MCHMVLPGGSVRNLVLNEEKRRSVFDRVTPRQCITLQFKGLGSVRNNTFIFQGCIKLIKHGHGIKVKYKKIF